MKKPFVTLKNRCDVLKLAFALSLCAAALTLFFLPDKSVTVSSGQGNYAPSSLFGLISNML